MTRSIAMNAGSLCLLAMLLCSGIAFAQSKTSTDANRVPDRVYLSDTDPAYEELERYQKSEADDFKKAHPDFAENPLWPLDEQKLRNQGASADTIEAMRAHVLVELNKPLPTRFENPGLYMQVRGIKERLEKAAAGEYRSPPELRVGTLLRLGEEAELQPESGASIAILPRFIFTFIRQLTTMGFDSLDMRTNEDQAALATRLVNFLDAFNSGTTSIPVDRRPQPPARLVGIGRMVEAMETFVLAHEYMHLLKEHEAVGEAAIYIAGEKAKILQHSWNQELTADLAGYRMMMRAIDLSQANPGNDSHELDQMLSLAPALFFQYKFMLDDAKTICETHQLPPEPGQAFRDDVTRVFEATMLGIPIDSDSRFAKLNGHPPAWARSSYFKAAAELDAKHELPPLPARLSTPEQKEEFLLARDRYFAQGWEISERLKSFGYTRARGICRPARLGRVRASGRFPAPAAAGNTRSYP